MDRVETSDYELLDSGAGRKLERFGGVTLSRPCAQAVWTPRLEPREWERRATAAFDREEGNQWHNRGALPDTWTITIDGLSFRLSGTNFGHLGIFPEQRAQWAWIRSLLAATGQQPGAGPLSVLNLFAYSGGATLAAAHAGAEVCHLDASKGMVQWARENAEINGLTGRPIRWIVDDTHKFLAREIKRGRRYDAVILDPPTFGRGQNDEIYKIERHLPETLALCRQVLSERPRFMLLSAHTPGFSPVVLANVLTQAIDGLGGGIAAGEMILTGARDVQPLPSGAFARWDSRAAGS